MQRGWTDVGYVAFLVARLFEFLDPQNHPHEIEDGAVAGGQFDCCYRDFATELASNREPGTNRQFLFPDECGRDC